MTYAKRPPTQGSDAMAEAPGQGPEVPSQPAWATAEGSRIERNRRWRDQNRDALEAYAQEVARNDLPLARFRRF